VDDSPYTEDLGLESVATREDLSALLRTVHLRADKPSLRMLEARTRHDATPLSKTSLSEMLKGIRLPRKAVMLAFLRACGVRDEQLAPWRHAWERIAVHEAWATGRIGGARQFPERDQAASASRRNSETEELRDRISQLNADNERLRLEMAAMGRRPAIREARRRDEADSPSMRSPTACRRELGILLRRPREEKGLTVEQVAGYLMCSPAKINRMEANFRSGTLRDVRDLCDLYGVVADAQKNDLMELAREGRQPGWWESYHLVGALSTYIGLEADATFIKKFECTLIPGLLQTADYARAIHESIVEDLSRDTIEEQIEVRMARQRLLTQADPPRLWSILDEAALHRLVGGPTVMKAQLEHLTEISKLPNVTLQVIPYRTGAHPAPDSNFTILEFKRSVPDMVYTEGLVGWIFLERPQEVERYQRLFEVSRDAVTVR
jgi:transcriptional regulator with XRE-family HTH domain